MCHETILNNYDRPKWMNRYNENEKQNRTERKLGSYTSESGRQVYMPGSTQDLFSTVEPGETQENKTTMIPEPCGIRISWVGSGFTVSPFA